MSLAPERRSRRRRLLGSIAATLPLFLLAGLLAGPGPASAQEGDTVDLSVQITDDPDPVAAGETVTFTLLVANSGMSDAFDAEVTFSTEGVAITSAFVSGVEGGDCDTEGATEVTCFIGYIPTDAYSSEEFEIAALEFNEVEVVIGVEAPGSGGSFTSEATTSDAFLSEENLADNEDTETTTVEGEEGGGDSDSGTIDPGESLTTVPGGNQNPVSPSDPFAVSLQNVSDGTLDGSVAEEPCDGTQEGDPFCSQPRVGDVLGNYQFTPAGPSVASTETSGGSLESPVVIARLFYDKTIVEGIRGFKIFYQKDSESPVLRLQRCKAGVRISECFKTNKKKSGDQIVRVPLSSDPRIARG